MASIDIKVGVVSGNSRAGTGATMEVLSSSQVAGEVKTPSGTSSQSTITAGIGQVWEIQNGSAAVRLKFGANPTAVDDATSWLLKANERMTRTAEVALEKVAVITSAFS